MFVDRYWPRIRTAAPCPGRSSHRCRTRSHERIGTVATGSQLRSARCLRDTSVRCQVRAEHRRELSKARTRYARGREANFSTGIRCPIATGIEARHRLHSPERRRFGLSQCMSPESSLPPSFSYPGRQRATEISYSNFAHHLHTNTIGPIITAQRLLATGLPIGTIVFMSSDSGSALNFRDFEDGFGAYAASKAALNQMLRVCFRWLSILCSIHSCLLSRCPADQNVERISIWPPSFVANPAQPSFLLCILVRYLRKLPHNHPSPVAPHLLA